MVHEPRERNPADFPVLGLLYDGPAHGYELCHELQSRLGEIWTLRTSHIYALLARLERDGLVHHERVDQETRPAKKIFNITDDGRDTFLTWARSPVLNVRQIRLEFLAKLHFARLHSPDAAVDLIDEQESVCRKNLNRLNRRKGQCGSRTELDALGFRMAMLEATITWLGGLRSSVDPSSKKASPGKRHERVTHQSAKARKAQKESSP